MLRWLGNALHSSVGRKLVMGLTGLLLVGFLFVHLAGNMKLMPGFGDPDGHKFDSYVAFLKSFKGFLILAEVGLAALFLCHIYLAMRLSLENLHARKQRYEVRSDRGAKTFGSASMFFTGALLFLYLIKHMLDFRFNAEFDAAPAQVVIATITSPLGAVIYVGGALLVGVHLSHGIQSAFQSLGLSHPRWTPLIRIGGRAVAALLALGFAAVPLYFLLMR